MSQTASRFFFGTNLKMHQTAAETRQFLAELKTAVPEGLPVQLFVIPPFTSLPGLRDLAGPAGMWVGAQNMHWAPAGAFTGEISAPMLTSLGVDLVMLGHAERRRWAHETDQELQKKVNAALGAGLRVLLCVGEAAFEKECGAGCATVERQLHVNLHDVPPSNCDRLLIAYEPVWSIGEAGTPAIVGEVAPVIGRIRATLCRLFGAVGQRIPVLYGGSVNLENCRVYAAMTALDGLFVGRAAWTATGFAGVLAEALHSRKEGLPQ